MEHHDYTHAGLLANCTVIAETIARNEGKLNDSLYVKRLVNELYEEALDGK